MITRIDKAETFLKHITCDCEYKFDSTKGNSNWKWNNDKCWCESEKLKKYHAYNI